MTIKVNSHFGLSNNTIKIIAAIAMLCDHIGAAAYEVCIQFGIPLSSFLGAEQVYTVLRCIGRISMPLFAFLIAEGCRYTHDRKRYFFGIFLLGLICDITFYVAFNQIYFCILTTFSAGILIIYAYDGVVKSFKERDAYRLYNVIKLVAAISFPLFLQVFTANLHGSFDYGIFGAMLPLAAYVIKNRWLRLIPFTLFLAGMCLYYFLTKNNSHYWYSMFAVPILALYNGERGKLNLKNFFYLFYPIHLVVVYGIFYAIAYFIVT